MGKNIILMIQLAYSITTAGKRSFSLQERVNLLGIFPSDSTLQENMKNINDYYLNQEWNNPNKISMLFILGFYLGDGNMFIRIRKTITGIQLIPVFRITQKNNDVNYKFYQDIVIYLNEININSYISKGKSNIEIKIEGKNSISNLINIFIKYNNLYFWKQPQFTLVINILEMININIRLTFLTEKLEKN